MLEEIDSLDLFVDDDFVFDFDAPVFSDSPAAGDFSSSSPDSMKSWIGQIESMLMNDDGDQDHQVSLDSDQKLVSDFSVDILVDSPDGGSGSVYAAAAAKVSDVPGVDSPTDGSGSGDIVADKEYDVSDDSKNGCSEKETGDVSAEKNSLGSNGSGKTISEEGPDGPQMRNDDEDEDEDDQVAKKRRRQLRNRDAAVRSRERKKMYLKDLESKSKYLERECTKLGRLLQCVVAENQALRLCLQNGGKAYDASITKQESAVLLWESLLLGSLLWYLWGVICQFPQPRVGSPLLLKVTVVEARDPKSMAPKGRGSSETSSALPGGKCAVKSRRCKASRPKMKPETTTSVAILA